MSWAMSMPPSGLKVLSLAAVFFHVERVERTNLETRKVTYVPRHHDEMVDDCRSGDQGVLELIVRAPVHEPCPGAECAPVDRQYIPSLRHLVDPAFDLGGLIWVLFAGQLDACLQLT